MVLWKEMSNGMAEEGGQGFHKRLSQLQNKTVDIQNNRNMHVRRKQIQIRAALLRPCQNIYYDKIKSIFKLKVVF